MQTTPGIPTVPGFRLRHEIGKGGSGTVWSAVRTMDDRRFAVKIVPGSGGGPDAQALRELAVLTRVTSEHLVQLHATLPLPDGSLAMVLDLVDGGSFAEVVAARGHLHPGEVVTSLAPVCRALADLHAAGVIHGDLSPANVIFTPDGRPVVADLGVAGLTGEGGQVVHATAGFVAPEVLDGAGRTSASDVYAVGALAWHALVGAPPIVGPARPDLSDLAPGVPALLEAAVLRCLSPDAGDRPTAAGAAVDLFDAVPAMPVRLATGTDPASAITHRIRAGAASADELSGPRAARHRSRPLRGAAIRRTVRRRARWPTGWTMSWPVSRPIGTPASLPVGRPTMIGVAAAVVVVALLAVGGMWLRGTWESRSVAAPSAPRAATSTAPGPVGETAWQRPVVMDRSAPKQRTTALVQHLADQRADALSSRDAARLPGVYTLQSPSLASDRDTIAQVLAGGASYVGLALVVREADWLGGTTQEVRVRARIDASAYQVGYADGRRTSMKARPAQPVMLTLAWTQQGWRIKELVAAIT